MAVGFTGIGRPPSVIGRLVPVGLFGALAAGGATAFFRQARGPFSYPSGWSEKSIYDTSIMLPIMVMAMCAVILAIGRSRTSQRTATVAGLAAAAQIAGAGAVAYRRWLTSSGFTTPPDNLRALRGAAATLAIGGVICCGAAIVMLWPDWRRRSVGAGRPWTAVVGGVVVAVAVPLAMGYETGSGRVTALGAHALMYSLPWGLGVVAGVRSGRSAAAAGSAVVLIAALSVAADPKLMIPAASTLAGCLIALVVVASVSLIDSLAPK